MTDAVKELREYLDNGPHTTYEPYEIADEAITALEAVLELHQPVEVEPSETICAECSFRLPNGRYFGKIVEYPCPTVQAIHYHLGEQE